MPVRRSRRPRRLSPAGVLLAALGLALSSASALPASAAPEPLPVPVRGSAYLGIGVLAHDGESRSPGAAAATRTEGVDVSAYQGNVAWSTLWSSGVRWAYTKATEGTYYTNPYFTQQYDGAYGVGMIRGSYHFATPDTTSGTAQANYFVDHGGGWSKDGRTLPGVLDIEWNPYGASCYGKSASAMVAWISDFVAAYHSRTGRYAVIYTSTSWWSSCTGNHAGLAAADPLWIARYASDAGTLPAGYTFYTMWQYTSSGPTVGDHDAFNGALDRVTALANG
ncbi:lysozyme [Streptomyces sp. NPDC005423]|uniref:lysozyme n=1 Tax=Streptomyces sp. NPDC005423 TaxID=3155343 RepID=UPI0033B307F9